MSLETDLYNLFDGMTGFDKEATKAQMITQLSTELGAIIRTYVAAQTVTITPVNVVTAAMSNSGGPVVAANNLNGILVPPTD